MHRQPASDYAVYSAVLRAHFVAPPSDAHADGDPQTCDLAAPVDHLSLVRETMLRRRPGGSRDSALARELSPQAAPMLATLRALSAQPSRVLDPDSFTVPVPVVLADTARHGRSAEKPITLSRVAYSPDSADALVLAGQPCTGTRKRQREAEEGEAAQGRSVLVALHRQQGAWVVRENVQLNVE